MFSDMCATGDVIRQSQSSKSIDMRWHWTRNAVRENTLKIIWRKGAYNDLADYFTKNLPVQHQLLAPSSHHV
jgi:hypothetical protein